MLVCVIESHRLIFLDAGHSREALVRALIRKLTLILGYLLALEGVRRERLLLRVFAHITELSGGGGGKGGGVTADGSVGV